MIEISKAEQILIDNTKAHTQVQRSDVLLSSFKAQYKIKINLESKLRAIQMYHGAYKTQTGSERGECDFHITSLTLPISQ